MRLFIMIPVTQDIIDELYNDESVEDDSTPPGSHLAVEVGDHQLRGVLVDYDPRHELIADDDWASIEEMDNTLAKLPVVEEDNDDVDDVDEVTSDTEEAPTE